MKIGPTFVKIHEAEGPQDFVLAGERSMKNRLAVTGAILFLFSLYLRWKERLYYSERFMPRHFGLDPQSGAPLKPNFFKGFWVYFTNPTQGLFLYLLWLACLVGGVWMIYRAVRMDQASRSPGRKNAKPEPESKKDYPPPSY